MDKELETYSDRELLKFLYELTGQSYGWAQTSCRQRGKKGDIEYGTFWQLMPNSIDDGFFDWYCDERLDYQFFKNKYSCILEFIRYRHKWIQSKVPTAN